MIISTLRRRCRALNFTRWTGRTRVIALALGASLAIAAVAGGVTGLIQLSDRQSIESATTDAVRAAEESVPEMLTYAPETVQSDLDTATGHTTGDFRDKLSSTASQVIVPSAQSQGIKTEAKVAGTSVVSTGADSVSLLMFVNQTTTTRADPTPRVAGSRVKVTMTKDGSSWKISDLAPI